jgi:anti-sigma B factor antagonist
VELELEIVDSRGVKVVYCRGRLVFGNEAYFQSKVMVLLPEFASIVLELKDLKYLDSTGLGAVMTLRNKAREAGGDVKLASVSPYVHKILETTKVLNVFQIFDDERQAITSFTKTGA